MVTSLDTEKLICMVRQDHLSWASMVPIVPQFLRAASVVLSCDLIFFRILKVQHCMDEMINNARVINKPFPRRQIVDSSELNESADDNFKFNEYGRNFSTRVENALERGEIVQYGQILLFPQCFQKTCTAGT